MNLKLGRFQHIARTYPWLAQTAAAIAGLAMGTQEQVENGEQSATFCIAISARIQ
jgi:hypothetical protein